MDEKAIDEKVLDENWAHVVFPHTGICWMLPSGPTDCWMICTTPGCDCCCAALCCCNWPPTQIFRNTIRIVIKLTIIDYIWCDYSQKSVMTLLQVSFQSKFGLIQQNRCCNWTRTQSNQISIVILKFLFINLHYK